MQDYLHFQILFEKKLQCPILKIETFLRKNTLFVMSGVSGIIKKVREREYGDDRSLVLPILQEIQKKYGYLPREALEEVSRELKVPLAEIFGVATFYAQFKLHKPGRFIIQVCKGTACHVKGADAVIDALQTNLGIKVGETTKDGLFTLEVARCFGACAIAPVVKIGEDIYGNVTPSDIPKILAKYRRLAKQEVSSE